MNHAEKLKKVGAYTIGGILSGIIANFIRSKPLLFGLKVSAVSGLSAGVIMELFDRSEN